MRSVRGAAGVVSAALALACSSGGGAGGYAPGAAGSGSLPGAGGNVGSGGGAQGGANSGSDPSACALATLPSSYVHVAVVKSETPGLAADAIVGQWVNASGATFETVVSQGSLYDVVQHHSSGSGYIYDFRASGSYTLTYVFQIESYCSSSAAASEHGHYSFDGTSLTLTPEGHEVLYNVCGQIEQKVGKEPPRTLAVSSAVLEEAVATGPTAKSGPGIVLRGPCPSFVVEVSCTNTGQTATHLQNVCSSAPSPNPTPSAPTTGSACSDASQCPSGLVCDTSVVGGYCTLICSDDNQCPGGACVLVKDSTAACLAVCNGPGSCPRPSDSCVSAGDVNVCVPA